MLGQEPQDAAEARLARVQRVTPGRETECDMRFERFLNGCMLFEACFSSVEAFRKGVPKFDLFFF